MSSKQVEPSQLVPPRPLKNMTKGLKEESPPEDINDPPKGPKGPKVPKPPKNGQKSMSPVTHGGRRRKTRSKRKGTRRH